MKTLANCTPREFLIQSNKIRKSVKNWLTLTKVMEIRKTLPSVSDKATEAEQQEALEKQINENINRMLDAILDEYPNETAELLGLMCFIDPEDLDNHPMTDFFGAISEMLNSREVIDFFISLIRLVSANTSDTAKA